MNPRPFLLCTLLVSAAALAGCAAPPKGPAALTGTIDVEEKNFKFAPAEVTIKVGSTVRWTNHDSTEHDVTGRDKAWQSDGGDGGMPADGVYSKTFDTAGTFDYYCTVHSSGPGVGMSGKIVVVA